MAVEDGPKIAQTNRDSRKTVHFMIFGTTPSSGRSGYRVGGIWRCGELELPFADREAAIISVTIKAMKMIAQAG